MSLSAKLRRAPLRLVTGAYIVNSGVTKLSADEDTAKMLHGMATGTYGFLGNLDPKVFAKLLAAGEITVGGALLLPFVSPVIAGGALVGFSGALLNMYWQTEGMHKPGDPRPTQAGTAISKDVWMFGIGTGLIVDGLLEPAHDKKVEIGATVAEKRAATGRKARKARKKLTKANKGLAASTLTAAKDLQADAGKRARKASAAAEKAAARAEKRAAKATRKASKKAGARLDDMRSEYGPVVAERAKHARDVAKGYVDEYGPVVADKAKHAVDVAKDYVDEYGPVAAEKAKQAGAAARDAAAGLVDEYGPVVADKAKQARDAAAGLVDEYGPVVADKAKQARDAAADLVDEYGPVVADKAKQARDAAADLVDEYGPTVADKAKAARDAAQDAAGRAKAAAGR